MPSRGALASIAITFLILIPIARDLRAATITVTSTATSSVVDGAVTLPEAITSIDSGVNIDADVVASGTYGVSDTILFAIPGPGVHTITLAGGLVALSKPMTIDGLSQPGSSANTLTVGDNAILTIELSGGGLTIGVGADGTVIRGLVINNASSDLLFVASSGNIIAGNFIGTNTAGSVALPAVASGGSGIHLYGGPGLTVSNNVIGGVTPADRNVISGNVSEQVFVYGQAGGIADGNKIEGNYIGAGADGLTYIGGATSNGVRVVQADHTLIGGTAATTPGGACTGACNVIYGPYFAAVIIQGDDSIDSTVTNTVGTSVQGNFIGPNATGNAPLAIDSSTEIWIKVNGGATIGGTTPAARNVISGGEFGVFVAGDHGNVLPIVIQGNYLGLNSAGTATLPGSPLRPGYGGITAFGSNILIGGTAPGAGNVIGYDGIQNTTQIDVYSSDNVAIQGNLIGTLADGTTAAGPRGQGIFLIFSTNVTIGATSAGGVGGNTIAGNTVGVFVEDGVQSRIFGNSIFGNDDPIDLAPFGINPNDDCDADSGPNDLQNFPIITSAVSNGTSITINGTLNSIAGATFALDFFSDTAASGQARTPLGAGSVTTNVGCSGTFSATLPFAYAPSMIVRATATNGTGNTSELSAAAPVELSGPVVTKSFAPGLIGTGATSVMTITLTNTTNIAVNGVSVTDSYPAGLVNAPAPAASTTCGGSLTATAGGGVVTLSGGTIPAGGACTITVTLSSQAPNLYTNTIGAGTVMSSNTLSNAGAGSATLTVATPLTVTKAFSPAAVLPNTTAVLTVRLSNPNPFPVTGVAFIDSYPSGLVNASPANAATSCGGSVVAGTSSIMLSGGTVPANSSCVVNVTVVSSTEKLFTNVLPVGSVTVSNALPNAVAGTATLIVSTNIPAISVAGLLLLAAALAIISYTAITRN